MPGKSLIARLLVAAMLGAIAWVALPAAAAEKPAAPVLIGEPGRPYDVVATYFGAISFYVEKPIGTTLLVVDPYGNEMDCFGPVDEPSQSCTIDDYYASELLAGTTQQFALFSKLTPTDLSDPAFISVHFAESVLAVDDPGDLLSPDKIVLNGDRQTGSEYSMNWSLVRGSTTVVRNQSCDPGPQGDNAPNNTYSCVYDSNAPAPRGGAASAVHPALHRPAGMVLPAVVPNGSYTATINEFKTGVVDPIDTITISFSVSTSPAAPGGGGGGGGDGGDDGGSVSAAPIPLAPIPSPEPSDPEPTPEPTPAPTEVPEEQPEALPPVTPLDDDVLRILILAVIAFTVMAMSGARGVGLPRRLTESPVATGPNLGLHRGVDVPTADASSSAAVGVLGALGGSGLDGADDDAGRERPFGDAWGDRSITWRFPGWKSLDSLSFAAPVWLASRLPLVSRIGADGAYLRASFGVLWGLLPLTGVILGAVAATTGGAAPLPPALGLVAVLLVLAVVDASAGVAAVTAFTLVTLARGGLTAEGLTMSQGVRGLMGLAALWFIAPLVAAAARPLRRTAEPDHVYSWDRFGDTVIAALVSGWAVSGIVGSLGDLTGKELAISSHAGTLALITIAAVIGRFLLEETVATLYPRRLHAVQEHGELPEPSILQQVRALVVRAALLAFFAGAFLGNCWQLWLGVAIFAIPQVLQLLGDRIPDIRPLASGVPRGVVQTLVMVLIGTAIAYLVDSRGSEDQLTAIRQGFVLLAIPGAALEILSVFGGDAPRPTWTWPKQLAGAVVVAVTAGLVLFLL